MKDGTWPRNKEYWNHWALRAKGIRHKFVPQSYWKQMYRELDRILDSLIIEVGSKP